MNKWRLCLLAGIIIIPLVSRSQDTIAGWTFPTGVTEEVYANIGNKLNLNRVYVQATDSSGMVRPIEMSFGAGLLPDFAATSNGWDKGDHYKYWQIDFISFGYINLTLSAKQRSGNTKPGPKYFLMQYKVGSRPWSNIPETDVDTLNNEWTVVANALQLPAACENSADTIHIRWLMITNMCLNNYEQGAIGITKIDDIFITGARIEGINDAQPAPASYKVLPNISSGLFKVIATEPANIAVINTVGSLVAMAEINSAAYNLDLSDQPEGIYFIVASDRQGRYLKAEKIFVVR
jgi:hypothetical protein